MAQAKRVVRFEAAAKSRKEADPPKVYGPRRHGKAVQMKFRVSEELKERIENQAESYNGMSVSYYLERAIATFIDSGLTIKIRD